MTQPQGPRRRVATVNGVNRALDHFNEEMAQKITLSMAGFHGQFVAPLEERIAYLELPWWKRLVVWVSTIRHPKKDEPPTNQSVAEVLDKAAATVIPEVDDCTCPPDIPARIWTAETRLLMTTCPVHGDEALGIR